jgi:hypothetical protein
LRASWGFDGNGLYNEWGGLRGLGRCAPPFLRQGKQDDGQRRLCGGDAMRRSRGRAVRRRSGNRREVPRRARGGVSVGMTMFFLVTEWLARWRHGGLRLARAFGGGCLRDAGGTSKAEAPFDSQGKGPTLSKGSWRINWLSFYKTSHSAEERGMGHPSRRLVVVARSWR